LRQDLFPHSLPAKWFEYSDSAESKDWRNQDLKMEASGNHCIACLRGAG
jgi:hypothetical protein